VHPNHEATLNPDALALLERCDEYAQHGADAAAWATIAEELLHRLEAPYSEQDLRYCTKAQLQAYRTDDTAQHAEASYGLSRVQTVDLVRVGRRLRELGDVAEALRDGRLTWEQVGLLARVAVPKHERAWLELALASSLEELACAVVQAGEGKAPPTRSGPRASERALPDAEGARDECAEARTPGRADAAPSAQTGNGSCEVGHEIATDGAPSTRRGSEHAIIRSSRGLPRAWVRVSVSDAPNVRRACAGPRPDT
jgi:hypothetical protein